MNHALWFCQIRVRRNGELFYGKGQCGDRGGAGVPGSVEGSAGQLAAKGCSQLLDSSVFQNPEFLSQPAPDASKINTAQAGQDRTTVIAPHLRD